MNLESESNAGNSCLAHMGLFADMVQLAPDGQQYGLASSSNSLQWQALTLLDLLITELNCILACLELDASQRNPVLVLQAEQLRSRLDAFLSFSEQSKWHLDIPEHGATAALQQTVPLFAPIWQHAVDARLLELLVLVLELFPVPRIALDMCLAGDDKIVPEVRASE